MGEFTEHNHKSMAVLKNGETIFERQIRVLSGCGIREFIVTTGPFEDQLKKAAMRKDFEGLQFTFVENPIYDKTNYIYSMYRARELFDDDFLLLHGDLVFNKKIVTELLADKRPNLGVVNKKKALPEKLNVLYAANDGLYLIRVLRNGADDADDAAVSTERLAEGTDISSPLFSSDGRTAGYLRQDGFYGCSIETGKEELLLNGALSFVPDGKEGFYASSRETGIVRVHMGREQEEVWKPEPAGTWTAGKTPAFPCLNRTRESGCSR